MAITRTRLLGALLAAWFLTQAVPTAQAQQSPSRSESITDTSLAWPGWDALARVLTLQDYNTRVVVIGTALLGLAAGLSGTFMLLRKRALMGDALSHATLPGIGLAFIVMSSFGATGKYLPGLLLGAALTGALGVGCVLLIRRFSRVKEDAALAIVLSTFFGLGVAILGVVQKMQTGHAAGLESFIYGKTASMLASDAKLIAVAAAAITAACVLLFKEFAALCFDDEFAAAQGWPVVALDSGMLALVLLVTVIGLQAVGLILMIAMLVIPPAAARFWTHHLPTMLVVSACIGAFSGLFGAALSALVPRLPAGAIIVVTAAATFGVSFIFGPARGALHRVTDHLRITRKVARQHLLRAMFERCEPALVGGGPGPDNGIAQAAIRIDALTPMRSWSRRRLTRLLNWARRSGLVQRAGRHAVALTPAGADEARRLVRNHRLWELYLITHADIAPSHVDRDADELEHVLGEAMVGKLEAMLADQYPHLAIPPSPHRLEGICGLAGGMAGVLRGHGRGSGGTS